MKKIITNCSVYWSVLYFFLPYIRWQFGTLLFHSLVEFVTVIIGILMFVIVLNTRKFI